MIRAVFLIGTMAGACAAMAQDRSADLTNTLAEKVAADDVVRLIARVPATKGAALRSPQALSAAYQEFRSSLLGAAEIEVVEEFDSLPLAVIEVRSAEALNTLQERGIVYVEDTLAEPMLSDSVPLVGAAPLHAAGLTGAGQTVAVLDTGVETTHPAFAGRVAQEACFSTTSTANGGSQSLCPNGQAEQIGGNAARGCTAGVRGCDHGTHVAGIVLGDGGGVRGMAPGADLMAVQVFSRFNSTSSCNGSAPCVLAYTSDQIRGLEHVLAQAENFDIAAANMSLGGGQNTSVCDTDVRKETIDALRALGIATVIASGNNGFSDAVSTPGCISTAITVGSSTKTDTLSGFSNSADMVDLLAPGSGISSAVFGGGSGIKNGTSMAAPHVAGAFALAMASRPAASVSQVEADLKRAGVAVTGRGITKPRIALAYLGRSIRPPASGPLAFGVMWFDGRKQSGTDNWSAVYNASRGRYEVTIRGERYYYLNYAALVTPAGDVRECRTGSVSGKLLITCADMAGLPTTARIAFAVYKP